MLDPQYGCIMATPKEAYDTSASQGGSGPILPATFCEMMVSAASNGTATGVYKQSHNSYQSPMQNMMGMYMLYAIMVRL